MKRLMTLAVTLLGLTSMPALAQEIFSKAGFEADSQSAVAAQKLHVAYFTASWCPPCKKMKAETWVDERIESWADANAVVSMIDIDEQQPLAAEYRVRSIPTIVVLMGDKEIGRTLGYQAPDEFLGWLDGYKESHLDGARAASGMPVKPANEGELIAPAEGSGVALGAAETMKMYLSELRTDMTGLGVTGSLLVPRLAELSETDAKLREEIVSRVRVLSESLSAGGAAGLTDVREFLQMAPIAGMQEEATAWIEAQLATPAGADLIEKHKFLAADLMARAGKYAEASSLVGDPVMHARKLMSAASKASARAMKSLDTSLAGAFESGQADLVRRELADAVAMALVAGEQAKAKAIAKLLPGDPGAAQGAIDAAAVRAGVESVKVED